MLTSLWIAMATVMPAQGGGGGSCLMCEIGKYLRDLYALS
jgi:hypothetical protein